MMYLSINGCQLRDRYFAIDVDNCIRRAQLAVLVAIAKESQLESFLNYFAGSVPTSRCNGYNFSEHELDNTNLYDPLT